MSDKKYPTRMHEVLGVEPGEPFKIIGSQCIDDFCISIEGRLQHADNPGLACCRSDLEYAINNGITRRPRLTEEQVKRLKAWVTVGYRWMAKNKRTDYAVAFVDKPEKRPDIWSDGGLWARVSGVEKDLVHWSDPEPLNIVQTLRDAGVGVEQ